MQWRHKISTASRDVVLIIPITRCRSSFGLTKVSESRLMWASDGKTERLSRNHVANAKSGNRESLGYLHFHCTKVQPLIMKGLHYFYISDRELPHGSV